MRRALLQENRSPRLSRVDVDDGLDLSEIMTRLVSGTHVDWDRFPQHLWRNSREHGSVIAMPAQRPPDTAWGIICDRVLPLDTPVDAVAGEILRTLPPNVVAAAEKP